MRQLKTIFFFFCFLLGLSASSYAIAGSDPTSMLRGIADNMISQLKSNKATLKSKPQIVYRLAYKYVVPYAGLNEMSKRVLPPSVWNSATPAQRKAFQKEFTTLLIRTYASALTSYNDQTIEFFPIRGGYDSKNTVEVKSEIVSPSTSPISVSYRLVRSGGGWRLFDMSVEGVSMLDSFRSQFSDILSKGDMSLLLQRMSGHNKGRE